MKTKKKSSAIMNGSKTKVENFTTKNGSGKQFITMNPENKQKAQKGRHACTYLI